MKLRCKLPYQILILRLSKDHTLNTMCDRVKIKYLSICRPRPVHLKMKFITPKECLSSSIILMSLSISMIILRSTKWKCKSRAKFTSMCLLQSRPPWKDKSMLSLINIISTCQWITMKTKTWWQESRKKNLLKSSLMLLRRQESCSNNRLTNTWYLLQIKPIKHLVSSPSSQKTRLLMQKSNTRRLVRQRR